METINKQWEQKTSYGASAKKSKLSKLKTRSMVDKEDNINNYSYLAFARMIITASPTLLSGEGIYLSTMETINKQWEQKTSYGASAKKSKLSKLKTMRISLINNENNYIQQWESMMKTMRINDR